MKVCLLNDSFPPLIDGVGNTVVNYAKNIKKFGGEASVVTPYYPIEADDTFDFPVVRYPSVDMTRLFGYRAGYPFDPKVLNGLDKENFDILHSHCPIASNLLARTLRQITDAPLVFTYHTKFDIDIKKVVPTEPLQKLAIKLLVNNIRACDEVWVVSNGAGKNLQSLGFEGEYQIMQNGVDLPKGRVSQEAIQAINVQHGIASDEIVFLFVGRMMWYKGIRLILDAVKKAKNEGAAFRVLFVGDGTDLSDMLDYAAQLEIQDRCIFAGAERDREKLRAYFCRANLFLFPSSYDTNGIVVREAAACGLASLLIRGSCAAEGITQAQNGILCAENAEAIAQVIHATCQYPDKIREIGENAMNEIYISWETAVKIACERYQIIHEKYLAGDYRSSKRIPLDTVFDTFTELSTELRRLRELPQRLKNKSDKKDGEDNG